MTGRVRAAYDRLGPWPVFAAFAAVGAAAWALALSSLIPLLRAFDHGAPLISLAADDGVGLPIGVTFFAFAAMSLAPSPAASPRVRGGVRRRAFDWPVLCLWLAAGGVALSLLAGTITAALVGSAAARRGYVACPAVEGERHARLRWTLATSSEAFSRCPRR